MGDQCQIKYFIILFEYFTQIKIMCIKLHHNVNYRNFVIT